MKDERTLASRIGVLMGGCSSERSISLKSGKAIAEALKTHGCQICEIDITAREVEKITSQIKAAKIDVAFIALHGELGEDGTIQAILERLHLPYPGSGVQASRLAINKVLAQSIFRQSKIPVPDFTVVNRRNEKLNEFAINEVRHFPVMVKPANQGSSIGIYKAESKEDLGLAIQKAFEYDEDVLIERFIKGKELTVGILEDKALPVIEIRPRATFFDYTAKYQAGMTEYLVPAQITPAISGRVQKVALEAFHVLGCKDFSRVDVMLDEHEHPFVLEINTIPGFTATSLLPKAAKAVGMDFTELCLKLVELAYQKQKTPEISLV